MRIQSLHERNRITPYAYRICMENAMHTVKDLETHYLEHGTFTNLINCSRVREEELKELIRTFYRPAPVEDIEEEQDNQYLLGLIASLNQEQHKALQSAMIIEIRMLSYTPQKQIRQRLASNLSPETIVKSLFIPKTIAVTQFEGLTEKHLVEIRTFLKNIKSLIAESCHNG